MDRTVEEILELYRKDDPTELFEAAWEVTSKYHGDLLIVVDSPLG